MDLEKNSSWKKGTYQLSGKTMMEKQSCFFPKKFQWNNYEAMYSIIYKQYNKIVCIIGAYPEVLAIMHFLH